MLTLSRLTLDLRDLAAVWVGLVQEVRRLRADRYLIRADVGARPLSARVVDDDLSQVERDFLFAAQMIVHPDFDQIDLLAREPGNVLFDFRAVRHHGANRAHLRAKIQATIIHLVVEWLDSERIAGENQPP